MLSLTSGRVARDCEGRTRREFLRVGTLGLGGLTLASLFRAQAMAAEGEFLRDKAVVMLFLGGGASHIETFNPNCDQPEPYRSLTGDLQTTIPGVRFGGTFPQLARLADQMVVVRSFSHGNSNHGSAVPYVLSGGGVFPGGMGAAYARIRGVNHPQTGMPTTALLTAPELGRYQNPTRRIVLGSQPGGLGGAYAPFNPDGDGPALDNMTLNISPEQLDDRRTLLNRLGGLQRQLDGGGALESVDRFRQQAFDLILGGAARAFDLSQEDSRTVARYDTSMFRVGEKKGDIRPCTLGKQMLLARRLIESGCGFVTVANAGWDMHGGSGNNFMPLSAGMEMLGRPLDKAVSALLEDLAERGLSEKVLLVITGEFGRTPKVNKNAGRDHWGNLSTLALAGGGLPRGQVVGRSTRQNDVPDSEPVSVANLMATVMHVVFDIGALRLARGIPREILSPIDAHQPIPGLI